MLSDCLLITSLFIAEVFHKVGFTKSKLSQSTECKGDNNCDMLLVNMCTVSYLTFLIHLE